MVNKDILEAALSEKQMIEKGYELDFKTTFEFLSKVYRAGSTEPKIKDDRFALLFRRDFCHQIDFVDLETYKKKL